MENKETSKGLQLFLSDVLTIFKDNIKGVKSIELFSSQFTPQQLLKISKRTPAILLSLLGTKNVSSTPAGREVTLDMACFILVGNARSESKKLCKNLAILPFIEGILAILDSDKYWQLYGLPENIQSDNLYSATGLQVAVWSIKWEQTINLGDSQESLENLADFLKLGVTWGETEDEKKEQ